MKNENTLFWGKEGEEIALTYIRGKGYKILEQNFKCKIGEIDIVSIDKNTLVFIEVKLRKTADFGYPMEAVTRKKQDKIRQVASYYLSYRDYSRYSIRFDVISIIKKPGGNPEITHLENCF